MQFERKTTPAHALKIIASPWTSKCLVGLGRSPQKLKGFVLQKLIYGGPIYIVRGWYKRSPRPFWEGRSPLSATESGTLQVERDPMGSRSRAPGGRLGAKPPEGKHILAYGRVIFLEERR